MYRHLKILSGHWAGTLLCAGSVAILPCHADITNHPVTGGVFDTSSTNTLSKTSETYTINASDGLQKGGNLFHSFGLFNLSSGETADFTSTGSTTTISNIISRVTDGQSTIDGTIKSSVSGADFYFFNPAGIIFNQNATLNLSGSFFVGTADSLKLSDGVQFNATNPGSGSTLTSATPSAFGFFDNNIASFNLNGSFAAETTLAVSAGKTLMISAGDVNLSTRAVLNAQDGLIKIASVASSGEVSVTGNDITTNSVNQFGKVQLTIGSKLDTRGFTGGRMVIKAGQLTVSQSQFLATTFGPTSGQGINIETTGNISIENGSFIVTGASAIPNTTDFSVGNAGDINVKSRGGNITLKSGAKLLSQTLENTQGKSGNITVTASQGDITLNTASAIKSNIKGTGNAGAITLTAKNISLTGAGNVIDTGPQAIVSNGQLVGFATGNGGKITLNASNAISIEGGKDTTTLADADDIKTCSVTCSTAGGFTAGAAGDIEVNTKTLTMNGVSELAAFSNSLTGAGGAITVNADDINLNGEIVQISTGSTGSGKSGDITLTATNAIKVTGLTTAGNTGIGSTPTGSTSDGSLIKLTADNIEIKNAFIEGTARHIGDFDSINNNGSAVASSINLTANEILLKNNSSIISTASGKKTIGGNIKLTSNSLSMSEGAIISTQTRNGKFVSSNQKTSGSINNAGNISIIIKKLILKSGAQIFSGTENSNGNSGKIIISGKNNSPVDTIIIKGISSIKNEPTTISVKAQKFENKTFTGSAGELNINVNQLTISNGGQIIGTSETNGSGGTLNIQASNIDISDKSSDGNNASGIFSRSKSNGSGGNINLTVSDTLSIKNGAAINVSSTSSGKGGKLTLNSNTINLNGNTSGILASSAGSGNGGELNITSGDLNITNQSKIDTSTTSSGNAGKVSINTNTLALNTLGKITSSTTSSGNGGQLSIAASQFTINNASISANTSSQGNGGLINITGKNLTLNNNAKITASSTGTASNSGEAGTINVNTSNFIRIKNSQINTDSTIGGGGNITLNTIKRFHITNGKVTTEVQNGALNAGNINIDPEFVVIENSTLNANAFGGNGGNINIIAQHYFEDPNSNVTASSAKGIDGVIEIEAPDIDVSSGLLGLPKEYLDAQKLLKSHCGSQASGRSSLVVNRPSTGGHYYDVNRPTSIQAVYSTNSPTQTASNQQNTQIVSSNQSNCTLN
jgi:filamentous hemagglutinin family protein